MQLRVFPLVAFAAGILSAQENFRFSGYAVHFPVYQRMNAFLARLVTAEQNQFVDVTRVRLRPSAGLWAKAFLMVEYEFNATYTSSPFLFSPSASRSQKQVLDLTWNPVHQGRWNVVHYVDRAYVRQSSPFGDLTIGRQRISWGTGRVWNPTDLFNPINPVAFSKLEKDGIDAVMAKFVAGNLTDLSLVYNPYDRFRKAQYGGRFRTNYEGFDFSVMGGLFGERIALGADFAGSLFDTGIRGEGIISGSRTRFAENFAKYILGIDNQFTGKLYAMMEYHYNGQGKNQRFAYELNRLVDGEILNLGKHYATGQISYLIHPLVFVSVTLNRSFTDGSGFVGGTAAYSASDEISIALGSQYFFGKQFDEYWYYPSTVYGKIDIYF
ncbi:MAG: hypothetical protein HYW57_06585 [Ignavibacteriales bacterium]|nr:hypothetical protein [Ignavibacteriales bacterium]